MVADDGERCLGQVAAGHEPLVALLHEEGSGEADHGPIGTKWRSVVVYGYLPNQVEAGVLVRDSQRESSTRVLEERTYRTRPCG
jgi:hypothetical protein